MTMRVLPTRAASLASACAAVGWWLASAGAAQAAAAPSLDSLVTAAVLLGGAGAAIGVGLLTLAALSQSLLGWRPRAAGALPAPLRRFLVGGVAAAVVAGVAAPAGAEEAYPGWAPAVPTVEASAESSAEPVVDGPVVDGPVVDAPVVDRAAVATAEAEMPQAETPETETPEAETPAASIHVVVRGESLWRIAAELLEPSAPDAAIARAWPLIYQANRSVIGDDPSLILPGQELTIPSEVGA